MLKNLKVVVSFFILTIIMMGCKSTKNDIQISDTLTAKSTLIYENDFDNNLDDWQVEQMEGGTADVIDGKLEINDAKGCTIWLKEKFEGPIMIAYDVVVIDNGGPHDRVSDLNCFWMAQDLENPTNILANTKKRGGKFSNYDSLRLYYMGVGGHFNTKTRFRRYVGNGERPLLPEHDFTDETFLLKANEPYRIKIIAFDGMIQYFRNDVLMVDFQDEHPYTSGHFGFRTVDNHMTVDNFKVYKLTKK